MTRLMWSTQHAEVGAVKRELFRAGIRSEIRSTGALNVTRLELWVENDNEFFEAQKHYANMQARAGNGDEPDATEVPTETPFDPENFESTPTWSLSQGVPDLVENNQNQRPDGELVQESSLLEEQKEVLKPNDVLSETSAALGSGVESLGRSLSDLLTAAEKTAAEFTVLQISLGSELAERTRSQDLLNGELSELRSRLNAVETTLLERQKRLETTQQQLQTQQGMVVELTQEIVSREQEWDENRRMVSEAQAELAVERQARIAAEENFAKSALALECLGKRLAEQKDLQEQTQTSIGSLNSLRGRLQSKKSSFHG